jgi:hypothetical protein
MSGDFRYLDWRTCTCNWKANDTQTYFKELQDGVNSRINADSVVTEGDLNARAGNSCVELGIYCDMHAVGNMEFVYNSC